MKPDQTKSVPMDAANVKTTSAIKRYLCSLAMDWETKELFPEMCQTCVVGCKYGARLLELLKEEEKREKKRQRTIPVGSYCRGYAALCGKAGGGGG